MSPATGGVLGRVLFGLGWGLAGLLVALVLLSPLAESECVPHSDGWRRVVALFAHDAVLRRTSLASACGLVVSACVFFRPGKRAYRHTAAVSPPRRPPPGVAGA